MWEYCERRTFPAKQKKTSSNEKTKSQKCTNKQTTKQENEIINTQTNKTIKT